MGRPRLTELDHGPAVEWLFLDLNAYFASVEQQARPELRGRPIAVVPLITPNTVCIAASYEAKRFGVKTGVKVRDAQKLCPQLTLVEARPKLYVEYHAAILEAVESCVPVTAVLSIDEAACRLIGRERWLPNALAIAGAVKQALREVGETLRCSIGLAPNRYLAKVGSDMQKPDGLTTLLASDLPQALFGLKPTDLPGIGRRIGAKLLSQGIATVEQLCALSRGELRARWGGVEGARLWHLLRGFPESRAPGFASRSASAGAPMPHRRDLEPPESERQSLGRQHVLAPELRTPAGAFAVAQQLLHQAAIELRRLGLWASGLGLAVNFLDDAGSRCGGPWVNPPSWKAASRMEACQDVFTLQAHLRRLWKACPARPPILVYVWLFELAPEERRSGSLFAADHEQRARATAAMDALNRRFGARTVYPGALHATRDAAPLRIAFRQVPRLDRF